MTIISAAPRQSVGADGGINSKASAEPRYLAVIVTAAAMALFAIVLSGVPTLADNEGRIATYVADVFQNGNWICPGAGANVASKPPMLTWLVALASLPFDNLNRFSLYLPSAAATLLVGLILLRVGRSVFGWQAGFLAAMSYLLSGVADVQMNTGRYDGLLALPTTLAAVAVFQAWTSGRKWVWFWLAAAAATLVKGPLGPVLAAGGLIAVWWEKRSGTPLSLRGSHWAGIAIFLLICGGWFLLAYHQVGEPLIDKLFGRELVGHAVGTNTGHFPFQRFHGPSRRFLGLFAPWSLIACLAFWRVWRRPSADAYERRFERFLFCWFFFGLLIFSAAAHQRTRLLFPLVPAAALLAGQQLALWARQWPSARIRSAATAAGAVFLLVSTAWHHVFLKGSRVAKHTTQMRNLTFALERCLGGKVAINYVDAPFEFRFYLNNASAPISLNQAAELLAGDVPAIVALSDFPKLQRVLSSSTTLHDLVTRPATNRAAPRVVSNVARPTVTNRMAFMASGLLLHAERARLTGRSRDEFMFTCLAPRANVTISNTTARPRAVEVRFKAGGKVSQQSHLLQSGVKWRFEADIHP